MNRYEAALKNRIQELERHETRLRQSYAEHAEQPHLAEIYEFGIKRVGASLALLREVVADAEEGGGE